MNTHDSRTSLDGKSALVTGSTSGIGLGMATAPAQLPMDGGWTAH
jgi:NAD(P)-dependent dehydrogenase (short-subunit alcohol dehydrogenase family)